MSLFCLLWIPLFYLLRRSFIGSFDTGGAVWALLLGTIIAVTKFLLGNFISPGGFGFSRWLYGFIDIVSLPVLAPLLIYFLLLLISGFSSDVDFSDFALLWLIPTAVMNSIGWSATNDVILLVAVPLLWTALAAGIPYFINIMIDGFSVIKTCLCSLCILLLPLTAASSYWAFFSHQKLIGFILFFAAQIPLCLSIISGIYQR